MQQMVYPNSVRPGRQRHQVSDGHLIRQTLLVYGLNHQSRNQLLGQRSGVHHRGRCHSTTAWQAPLGTRNQRLAHPDHHGRTVRR